MPGLWRPTTRTTIASTTTIASATVLSFALWPGSAAWSGSFEAEIAGSITGSSIILRRRLILVTLLVFFGRSGNRLLERCQLADRMRGHYNLAVKLVAGTCEATQHELQQHTRINIYIIYILYYIRESNTRPSLQTLRVFFRINII